MPRCTPPEPGGSPPTSVHVAPPSVLRYTCDTPRVLVEPSDNARQTPTEQVTAISLSVASCVADGHGMEAQWKVFPASDVSITAPGPPTATQRLGLVHDTALSRGPRSVHAHCVGATGLPLPPANDVATGAVVAAAGPGAHATVLVVKRSTAPKTRAKAKAPIGATPLRGTNRLAAWKAPGRPCALTSSASLGCRTDLVECRTALETAGRLAAMTGNLAYRRAGHSLVGERRLRRSMTVTSRTPGSSIPWKRRRRTISLFALGLAASLTFPVAAGWTTASGASVRPPVAGSNATVGPNGPGDGVVSLVPISGASLQVAPARAVITATVGWNAASASAGMTIGDVRVVAVNAVTRLPVTIAARTTQGVGGTPVRYQFTVKSPTLIRDLAFGNRVAFTATQHDPLAQFTPESDITVAQLQAGPSRGPVGRLDCSDVPFGAGVSPSYVSCDFTGAVLTDALVSDEQHRTDLRQADFTGAAMEFASVVNANMAGASLAGVDLSHAELMTTSAAGSFSPGLVDVNSFLNNDNFFKADLALANFSGSVFGDESTTFAAADLQGAVFSGAHLEVVELSFANATASDFQNVTGPTIEGDVLGLTFVDFTRATLFHESFIPPSELRWVILCHTVLRDGSISDRDC